MRCDVYQNLWLDHLYGLLDASDAAELDAHLTGCAGCVAARTAAARSQGLLARAAKSSFPNVRFVPPDQAVTVDLAPSRDSAAPSPVAEPAKPSRPERKPRAGVPWGRWVVAASLLVLIPAAVLPVSGWASKFDVARRTSDRAAAEYAAARDLFDQRNGDVAREKAKAHSALSTARAVHDRVLTQWVEAEKAAAQKEADNRISVQVERPASVQPGAPNEFVVHVRGPGREVVEAEVRDQDNAVLFAQRLDHEKQGDTHKLRLPAEVWARVSPQSELFLTVSKIDEKTGARTELQDKLRLFGPVYTTLLVTDKPAYRPGERLFFRSLTLDRVSFRPPAHEQLLRYELRKIDTKADGTPVPGLAVAGAAEPVRVTEAGVEPVLGPDGKPVRGVGCGSFALPGNLADGDYVLMLTEQKHPAGYAPTVSVPVKRSIRVRSGASEQYQKKIGFTAAAYSAGEVVEAWCELKSNDKPVGGVMVEASVIADNAILHAQVIPAKTRADGRVTASFQLPAKLERGDIQLRVRFKLPKGDETVTEQVPLAGRNVAVEFFPEGGELVAGVPGRVYVRATNANGQAVDVRGVVTDGTQTLARVDTLTDKNEPGVNRGLGVFTFTPQLGVTYKLELVHPAKVDAAFPLPAVLREGVVMTVPDSVTAPGQPVRVQLHSAGKPRNLVVGAYTRGRLADTRRVTVEPGHMAEVKLLTGDDPRGGVTRITVFEDLGDPAREWVPVAERLVFRKPGEKLNVAYTAKATDGPAAFGPGSGVELTIHATDEKGSPTPAIVWASVVNEAAVNSPRDRLMPTHFLLAGETQSPDALEHADFLLTDQPRAAECLDMVLATQGWRRFVEQKSPSDQKLPYDAAQLLATNGQFSIGTEASLERKHRELYATFWPRYEAAVRDLNTAKAAAATPIDLRPVTEAKDVAEARRAEAAIARDAEKSAAVPLASLRNWVWLAVAALVGVAAVLGALGSFRPNGPGGVLPVGIGVLAALGLAGYFGVAALDARTELASDANPLEPPQGAADVRREVVKSQAKVDVPPQPVADPAARTMVQKVGPFVGVMSADAVKSPHPVLIDGAQKMLPPDLRWDGREPDRDPAVRMHMAKTFASDAAEDPARVAATKAVADRAADFKKSLDELPQVDLATVERIRAAIPRMAPLVVREYAAPRPGFALKLEEESDTVLWQPLIVLPTDGKATMAFHLGTNAAGYRVMIAGHTPDGRIGAVRGLLPVAKTAPPPPVDR